MMLGGVFLVAAALRPPPPAPEPSRTFDLRTSTTAPDAPTGGGSRTAGRVGASSRPAPSAESVASGVPVGDPRRLRIRSIGVDAPVRREAVTGGGELVVPGDPGTVGSWHGAQQEATRAGTLVLAGHVDSHGDLGALHPLANVGPGALVDLVDAAGHVETWRVDALEVRRKEDLPAFPPTGPRRLALVTCGGPVLRTSHGHSYRDNVIAWASPAR